MDDFAECPKSEDGNHIPSNKKLIWTSDGGDWYLDFVCKECGISGTLSMADATWNNED